MRHTVKPSKRELRAQQELDGHFRYSSAVKSWLNTHETRTKTSNNWGDTPLPVHWLVSPDKDIAARSLNQRHVDEVVESLQKYGIQVHRVKVLIWKEDLLQKGIGLNNIDFSTFQQHGPPPVKMQVIAGDHTIAAMKKMSLMRPNNPMWKTFLVRIVIAVNNATNKSFAQAVGSLDNKVAEVSKGASTWDNISQIHSKKEALDADPNLTSDQKKTEWTRYRNMCLTTMGGVGGNSVKTLGNIFAIAKVKGQLWKNIATIFQKDAEGTLCKSGTKRIKGVVKPLNQGPFCHMANLPQSDLIRWTQHVIDGDWSTSDFKARCLAVKKVHKLQEFILKHLNIMYRHRFNSFVDAAQEYPFLTDKAWVSQLLPAFNPSRKETNLPQSIANSIEAKVKDHVRKMQQDLQVQVVKLPFRFYLLFFLYGKEMSLCTQQLHTHCPSHSVGVLNSSLTLFRRWQRRTKCSRRHGQEQVPL